MANRVARCGLIALLTVWGLLATAAPSEAALVLRLTSGGSSVTLFDDGDGVLSFAGSLGTFSLNLTSGISKPAIGPAQLDLVSFNLGGTSGGTLTIELTDTDFDFGLGGPGSLEWAWGGTVTGGSIVGQAWKDPANAEFGHGSITSGELGPFAGPAFSTSGSIGHGILMDPYSMTIRLIYTTTSGGQFASGDFTLQNIPEPAELLLFSLGLMGVGFAARRRQRSH